MRDERCGRKDNTIKLQEAFEPFAANINCGLEAKKNDLGQITAMSSPWKLQAGAWRSDAAAVPGGRKWDKG
jgi:hypothetical protein